MSIVSYAQNFEDVMLWRALKNVENGFYIDVGANDPQEDSVTKAFYDHEWRGINIEPVSEWYEKLAVERVRDINLQLAVGAESGFLTLYEIPGTGLSTVNKKTAERHEREQGLAKIRRTVPVTTLTEICREYKTKTIHFLKIDVEGAEQQVLEGVNLTKIRPWIILVESTIPSMEIEKYKDWEPILLSSNYKFVWFDGLNRFYIAEEHLKLSKSFQLPPNVFDRFVVDKNQTFARQAIATIVSENDKVITDLAKKLDTARLISEKEGGKLEKMAKDLAEKLDVTRSNAEYFNKKLDEVTRELAVAQAGRDERNVCIQLLEDQQKQDKTKIEMYMIEIEGLSGVVHSVNHELGVIYSSKSWYVTKPLRLFYGYLNKLRSLLRRSGKTTVFDSSPAEPRSVDSVLPIVKTDAGAQKIDFSIVLPNVQSIYKRLAEGVAKSEKSEK